MMQPETWKAIGEYSGKVWTAVGPLVYVLIGGWLGRAWDRKKWELENRKQECRELLASISHAATVRLDVGNGHCEQEAYDAYLDSMKIFQDRIFIAADVEREPVRDLWVRAMDDLVSKEIDATEFREAVTWIQNTIIGLVVPKLARRFFAIRTIKQLFPRKFGIVRIGKTPNYDPPPKSPNV